MLDPAIHSLPTEHLEMVRSYLDACRLALASPSFVDPNANRAISALLRAVATLAQVVEDQQA